MYVLVWVCLHACMCVCMCVCVCVCVCVCERERGGGRERLLVMCLWLLTHAVSLCSVHRGVWQQSAHHGPIGDGAGHPVDSALYTAVLHCLETQTQLHPCS